MKTKNKKNLSKKKLFVWKKGGSKIERIIQSRKVVVVVCNVNMYSNFL